MALSWRSPERDTRAPNTKLSSRLYLEWLEKPQIQRQWDFYLNAKLPLFKKEYKTNVIHAVTDVPLVHELEVKVR